jgi:DNA-binding transcriptional regulator YiaG
MSELTLEGHLHRRCGGHYALAVEEVTIKLSGMTARVDRAMYKCDKCGDKQHTVEQREDAEKEAVLTMRHHHSLMTGKEIKQFRESIGLSAAQLGELLHGLPKGIVEGWEKGRYLQSPAVDEMIRSLSDREERERRAAKAGLVLPPIPGEVVAEAPAADVSAESVTGDTNQVAAESVQSVADASAAKTDDQLVEAAGSDDADEPEPSAASQSVYE